MTATLRQLQAAFDGAGQPYHILALQGQAQALITGRGARVLGIFPTPEAENLLWTPPVLTSPDAAAFLNGSEWNMGGERFWVAPELGYIINDANRFAETHEVPSAMDPGEYAMSASAGGVTFSERCTLQAKSLGTGETTLTIRRDLFPVADPLLKPGTEESRAGDVVYAGYAHRAAITVEAGEHLPSALWNLVQVPTGGILHIATVGETVEAANYFGDVPETARAVLTEGAPHIRIAITGTERFKIGYHATSMTGRMGYYLPLEDGRVALLVRVFFSNPSNQYLEPPPNDFGNTGYSVHVYNDDKGADSFGEMESTGTSVGGTTERTHAEDTFYLYTYVGDHTAIAEAARLLLGVRL